MAETNMFLQWTKECQHQHHPQCRIGCVGADCQAQQDSHTEIHQLYPNIRPNNRHINDNKARKLKFGAHKINVMDVFL